MADGGSCFLDIAPPPRMAPSGYEDDDIDYYYGDGYVLTVENAYYAGRLMGNNVGGLVGLAGRVSIKNSFFVGTSIAKGEVYSIGKRRGRICGGVNDTSNPAYYTPKNEITLNPATKTGDTFEGWFLDSNFKEPVDKILATDWGNQKFYAKWKNGYSITYVNDGSYEYAALHCRKNHQSNLVSRL